MNRLGFLAAVLIPAVAASAATIHIEPLSTFILIGESADLNVRITDVADLYAYQYDIAFNPATLSATSVTSGAFLSGGGDAFFIPGVIDNTIGRIRLTADTLLGPVAGVSGSGTLATINFQSLSIGMSPITLFNVVLLDSSAGDISARVQNGSVITNTPEPNSGLSLAIVLGLAFAYHRFRRAR
jgi:general secretion pathway protein D